MSSIHIIDMTTLYCHCGIPFSVPKYYHEMLKQGEKVFYCPNGHQLKYPPVKIDHPVAKKEIAVLETEKNERMQEDLSISETTIERRVERKAKYTKSKAVEYLRSLKNPHNDKKEEV